MLIIKPIIKQSPDMPLYKALYQEAFPPSERKPMRMLFAGPKWASVQFNAYYDGDTFVGFSQAVTCGGLTYVAYLAVVNTGRGKGYGRQILSLIRKSHEDSRIFLNMEIEDDTAPNAEQRRKRRLFYLKNDYTPTGLNMTISGNTLELVVTNGTCTIDEIRGFFRRYWGFLWSKLLKIKVWEVSSCNVI